MALNPKDVQQVVDNLRTATERVEAIVNTLLAASQAVPRPPEAHLAREVIGHLVTADQYLYIARGLFDGLLVPPSGQEGMNPSADSPLRTGIIP